MGELLACRHTHLTIHGIAWEVYISNIQVGRVGFSLYALSTVKYKLRRLHSSITTPIWLWIHVS